jgi:SAM-dependent methyltransferase
VFYGADQAAIHHERFGGLAVAAATDLLDALRDAGLTSGTVVDLGSGSGILAAAVAAAGYDVLGVDLSADMVDLARATAPAARFEVASVHDVDLPRGCVGVSATGEVLNYATDARAGIEALDRLAARVFDALAPGGTFLLDLSGPGRAGPTGKVERFHRYDGWCLGMVATEDARERRLDRAITIFVADRPGPDASWRRTDEHHVVRLYDREEVAGRLGAHGFAVEVTDGYRTPMDLPGTLPGWYVVRATKPLT